MGFLRSIVAAYILRIMFGVRCSFDLITSWFIATKRRFVFGLESYAASHIIGREVGVSKYNLYGLSKLFSHFKSAHSKIHYTAFVE